MYSIVYTDDTIVGYGVINKSTGDIPQIAVNRNHSGKGIGRSILTGLDSCTESDKISIINVDSKCDSMKNFLTNLGFNLFVKQYEMLLKF